MSNCQECVKVLPINRCANTIFIPQITGTSDGDFTVIITDLSTGATYNIPVTADLLTLLVPVSEITFMPNHTYKVQVFEGDFNEPREITIGVTSGCCVTFEVEDYAIGEGTFEILSLDGCE